MNPSILLFTEKEIDVSTSIEFYRAFDNILEDTDGCGTIDILINSGGGIITDALAIYDRIMHAKAVYPDLSIRTIVVGRCESCTNIIFCAGDERAAYKNSTFLFHDSYITVDCCAGKIDGYRERLINRNDGMFDILSSCCDDKTFFSSVRDGNDHFFVPSQLLDVGYVTEII